MLALGLALALGEIDADGLCDLEAEAEPDELGLCEPDGDTLGLTDGDVDALGLLDDDGLALGDWLELGD